MKKKLFLTIGLGILIIGLVISAVLFFNGRNEQGDSPAETSFELEVHTLPEEIAAQDVFEPNESNANLTAKDLIDSLYKLAGSPEIKATFSCEGTENKDYYFYNIPGDSEYFKSFTWAGFNGILYYFTEVRVPTDTPELAGGTYASTLRYGTKRWIESAIEDKASFHLCEIFEKNDDPNTNDVYELVDFEGEVTYTDAVIAMYYFATTYMGNDLSSYFDTVAENDISEHVKYNLYPRPDTMSLYESVGKNTFFDGIWEWAEDSGIVTGEDLYDRIPTQNEYSAMLENFIKYLSNL